MNLGLQGFFTIKIRQPCGTVRREYTFPNLILNNGLNGIGTNGVSWTQTCALGSSSTAPAVTDTGLITPGVDTITSNASTTGFVAGPPPYSWVRFSKRFAQGVATGTWSEVGIGRSSSNLWSRSLILDGGGSPTTITVLAIEVVDVEYELRCYPNTTDVTGTRTITGTSYSYTLRPAGVSSYSNLNAGVLLGGDWMSGGYYSSYKFRVFNNVAGAYNAMPTGVEGSGEVGVASVAAYSNGSYTKVSTVTASVADANLSGGIKTALFMLNSNATHMWQCEFNPVIAKDNTKTLSLTYSCTWARRT